MICFFHHDRQAVGHCKSCGRNLCSDCAVDIGKGLACRNACEEDARSLARLIDYNVRSVVAIESSESSVKLVQPTHIVQVSSDQTLSVNLSHYTTTCRRMFRWIGVSHVVLGILILLWSCSARFESVRVLPIVMGLVLVLVGVGLLKRGPWRAPAASGIVTR